MLINKEKCTGCTRCIPYCPMGAISLVKETTLKTKVYAEINQDECVECGVCIRADVCKKQAIYEVELAWPRLLRKAFSDPLFIHKGTRIPGRGTEEMKTNDVTGRFKRGQAGIAIEMGRPGTGTRFSDVQKVAQAVAEFGVVFERNNPVTQLFVDAKTGTLNPEILGEKVLSAIIEFIIPIDEAVQVLMRVREVAEEIDTVFSLDFICRVEPDHSVPTAIIAREAGLTISNNGKHNLGLGRPLVQD